MQTERRGNRQTARETEKEGGRECEHFGKMDVGVRHKTVHWKNPLTSFWDKLGRINFFWETILMEEIKHFQEIRLMTIGTTTCCTFSIDSLSIQTQVSWLGAFITFANNFHFNLVVRFVCSLK